MGRTNERQEINAPLICDTLTVLSGRFGNSAFDSADRWKAQNLNHLIRRGLAQNSGVEVASQSRPIYVAYAPGTIIQLAVFIETAPTGGDKQFTVDLQKSSAGGAFGTILSAVVTVDNSKTNLTRYLATLGSEDDYIAGDAFKVVIAVSGSTGSYGQGVCVELATYEQGEAA